MKNNFYPFCIFSVRPACGETVKQNLSYLIQEETTAPPEVSCFYKICPESSDVNRIRLDFTVIINILSGF